MEKTIKNMRPNIQAYAILLMMIALCFNLFQRATFAQSEPSWVTPEKKLEFSKWMSKSSTFNALNKDLVEALKTGDVEAVLKLTTIELDGVEGDSEDYVKDTIIPFFEDYYENGNEVHSIPEVLSPGKLGGSNTYSFFLSKKGKKKYFYTKIVIRGEKPLFSAIICNRRLADDHPQLAKERQKKRPQIEMIKPTKEPDKMWEAPKN